jgi:uncharacterized protein
MNVTARFLRRLLCGVFVAALFPGTTFAEAPVSAPDTQAIVKRLEAAPRRGVLFEVRSDKRTLYLFGTVHLGKLDFYPLNIAVTRALATSEYLAVEADISDEGSVAKEMAELAMYSAADSLDKHISPALSERTQHVLEENKFAKETAMKMKPWMLGMTLTMLDIVKTGYSPVYGADLFLLGLAKEMHKPVVELESIHGQFELMDGLAASEQQAFLADTIDELESGKLRSELVEIINAWAKADSSELEAILKTQEASMTPNEKKIYAKLITDRNATMTDRIEEFVRSSNQYFVAVGAMHLLGKDSIVARLKEKGYEVREMK